MALLLVTGWLAFVPAFPAHAQSSSSWVEGCGNNSNQYGCTWWSRYDITGNAYPGSTVSFAFRLYNTNPYLTPIWLNSFSVQLPSGQTYGDDTLPAVIQTGYAYGVDADAVIPSNTAPGNYTIYLSYQIKYSDGSFACSSTNNVCTDSIYLTVTPDPVTLQAQVTSMSAQVSALQSQVSSLNTQISTDTALVNTLTSQLGSSTTNLQATQASLRAAQDDLATARANLTDTQSRLVTAQGQLSTAQSQLASTLASGHASLAAAQSSLNTASYLYLPLAAAIPSAIAIGFAVLYMRKRPVTPVH